MISSDLFIGPIPEVEVASKSLNINDVKKQLGFLNEASISFLFSNFTSDEGINEKDILNLIPILSALKEPDEVLKTLSQYHLKQSDLQQIIQVLPSIKSFKTLVILKNLNLPEGAARDILYTLKKKPEMEMKIAEIFEKRNSLFQVPLKSNEKKGDIERQFTLELKDTLNLALKSNYFNAIFSNNQQEKLTEIVTKLGNDLPENEITPFLNVLSKIEPSDSTIDLFLENNKIILKYPGIVWSENLLMTLNQHKENKKELLTLLANNPGNEELCFSFFVPPLPIIIYFLKKYVRPIQLFSLALESKGFASFCKMKYEELPNSFWVSLEGFIEHCIADAVIKQQNKETVILKQLKLLIVLSNSGLDIIKIFQVLYKLDEKYYPSLKLFLKFKEPLKVINILSELSLEAREPIIYTLNINNGANSQLEYQLIHYFSNKPHELLFEGSKKVQLTQFDCFLLASNSPFLDKLLERKNFDFTKPIKFTDKATIRECLLYLEDPSLTIPLEDAGEFYCRIKPLDISVLEKQAVSVIENYLKSPEITIDDIAEFQQFCMGHPFHHFSNMFATLIMDKIRTVQTVEEFEYLLTIGRDCLTHISFPENGGDEWVSKLEMLPFLKSLNLVDSELTSKGIKNLSRLIKLESLTIYGIDLSNKLDFLLSLGRLRSLNITCSELKINDIFYISGLKNLKKLSLSANLLANNHLYLLRYLNKLESLYLNNPSLRDEHLTFLSHLNNLTTLELIGPNIEGLCLREVTKNLTFLILSCKNLINLENSPKATHIALMDCEILNNEELSKISESPNLKALFLLNCSNISDEDFKNFENLTSLRSLEITGCKKVSGEGLAYLYKLRNLNTLSVINCSLTYQAIMKIPFFPNLSTLDLSGNSDLKIVAKDYLKKMYPEAYINTHSKRD